MGNYKFKCIDSRNVYGTMNSSSIKLSNITLDDKNKLMEIHNLSYEDLSNYEFTKEDKKLLFKMHREALGNAFGFDSRKMFMADQVKKNGSYFEITKDYVEVNPNGWSDIAEDILITTSMVPGVVIGHPVADCPVIIMYDNKKGVAAVAHCSAELIDKKMPMMIADALVDAYSSNDEDISVYVGACAGADWTYDCYPVWAKDKDVWKDAIIEENGIFKIDMRKAIKKQLLDRKVGFGDKTVFNMDDTISNDLYYSNSASRNNQKKYGRQFQGAFFEESYKIK